MNFYLRHREKSSQIGCVKKLVSLLLCKHHVGGFKLMQYEKKRITAAV